MRHKKVPLDDIEFSWIEFRYIEGPFLEGEGKGYSNDYVFDVK